MEVQPVKNIELYEVGFRDYRFCHGLFIPTDIAANTIEMLVDAGIQRIEVGASVNYSKFQFMANSYDILVESKKRKLPATFSMYIPPFVRHYPKIKINRLLKEEKLLKEDAEFAIPDEICVSVSASEKRNLDILKIKQDEVIFGIKKICDLAKKDKLRIRGYVSAAFGYDDGEDDDVSLVNVVGLTELLFDFGCYEVALGDTRGKAELNLFSKKWETIWKFISNRGNVITLHFHEHDYRQWQRDVMHVLQYGIGIFDTSVIDKTEPIKKVEDATLINGNIPPNASTLKMARFVNQLNGFPEEEKIELGALSFTTGIDYLKLKIAHEYIRRAVEEKSVRETKLREMV